MVSGGRTLRVMAPWRSSSSSSVVGMLRVMVSSASSTVVSGHPLNFTVCGGIPSMYSPSWVTSIQTVSGMVVADGRAPETGQPEDGVLALLHLRLDRLDHDAGETVVHLYDAR